MIKEVKELAQDHKARKQNKDSNTILFSSKTLSLNHCVLILGTMMKYHCHPCEVFDNEFAFRITRIYDRGKKKKQEWKIISVDYFVGIKKVNQKGRKKQSRMSGNKERKSQGIPEEGNEAILRN